MPVIEVSVGELFDKITILKIKKKKIGGDHITTELDILMKEFHKIKRDKTLGAMMKELQNINNTLWGIEDEIREWERERDFGHDFIHLARQVYIVNDERSRVKRDINIHSKSNIVEMKSYEEY
jgi:hypothetical protein